MSNTLFVFLLTIVFFSCGRDFYVPSAGNLLILEEKNDLKVDIGINTAQIAYSPINNLGIKSDFAFSRLRNDNRARKLNQGTIGFGYYKSKEVKPLFPKTKKEYQRPQDCAIGFDIFANASLGQIEINNIPNNGGIFTPSIPFNSFESDIFRPSISGQVFWQSRTFTVNFGIRYGLINYYNGVGFGTFEEFELGQISDLVSESPFSVVDYDLKIAKGDNRIQSFLSVNWNQSLGLLRDNNAAVTFGLAVNVSKFLEDRKNITKAEPKPKSKKRKKRKR